MRFLKNCKGEVLFFFLGLSIAIGMTGIAIQGIIKTQNKYKTGEEAVTYLDEDDVIELTGNNIEEKQR